VDGERSRSCAGVYRVVDSGDNPVGTGVERGRVRSVVRRDDREIRRVGGAYQRFGLAIENDLGGAGEIYTGHGLANVEAGAGGGVFDAVGGVEGECRGLGKVLIGDAAGVATVHLGLNAGDQTAEDGVWIAGEDPLGGHDVGAERCAGNGAEVAFGTAALVVEREG